SGAVIAANPDVIIASWCGRKVNKDQIRSRKGWGSINAVRSNHIYEIKSTYILQPGPAALTEGVRQVHAILARVANCEPAEELKPLEALYPAAIAAKGDIVQCALRPSEVTEARPDCPAASAFKKLIRALSSTARSMS